MQWTFLSYLKSVSWSVFLSRKVHFFFSTSLNFTLILYNGGFFPSTFLHLCHPITVINSKAKSLPFKLFCFQGTNGVYKVFQWLQYWLKISREMLFMPVLLFCSNFFTKPLLIWIVYIHSFEENRSVNCSCCKSFCPFTFLGMKLYHVKLVFIYALI